jgi:hypothetical protein
MGWLRAGILIGASIASIIGTIIYTKPRDTQLVGHLSQYISRDASFVIEFRKLMAATQIKDYGVAKVARITCGGRDRTYFGTLDKWFEIM